MLIQLLGAKNKADFTIYLAHAISILDKRVLIVDATINQIYRSGYTLLEETEYLYDFQNITILAGAKDWADVENLLKAENEKIENFDCILLDIDSIPTLIEKWPTPEEVLYVSDNERFNIKQDIPLLYRWLDEYEENEIRRVHFDSSYRVPDGLIQLLMHNRIEFSPLSETIEYDEFESRLRLIMQHEQSIPYKKLNKQYRQTLDKLVSEWFIFEQSMKASKTSFFSFKKKDKQEEEVLEG